MWFQNRRTKHKRQKLEEETPESLQKRKGSQHASRWRAATQQGNEDVDVISEDSLFSPHVALLLRAIFSFVSVECTVTFVLLDVRKTFPEYSVSRLQF